MQKEKGTAVNPFVIICFIIWLYLLSAVHRAKLNFYQFLLGSIGTFIFLMIWVQPVVITPLSRLVTSVAGMVGNWTGMFHVNYAYSFIFINYSGESISLYIDYECSGIIEMMAFVSMLLFYQVYRVGQRVLISVAGCIYILFANVLRILIICTMTYFGGSSVYYIAHTVIGRIVFYALSIILYYYVFTYAQIIRQKIGGVRYSEYSGRDL